MGFLHPNYFPSCNVVPTETGDYEPWTLTEMMRAYWKIKRLKYSYNWNYDSGDGVKVTGSGESIMSGGKNNIREYVCPDSHFFETTQLVKYEQTSPFEFTEDCTDSVLLELNTSFIYTNLTEGNFNYDESNLYPAFFLTIVADRHFYFSWGANYATNTGAQVKAVSFFGKDPIELSSNAGQVLSPYYDINIKIDIVQENEN